MFGVIRLILFNSLDAAMYDADIEDMSDVIADIDVDLDANRDAEHRAIWKELLF